MLSGYASTIGSCLFPTKSDPHWAHKRGDFRRQDGGDADPTVGQMTFGDSRAVSPLIKFNIEGQSRHVK